MNNENCFKRAVHFLLGILTVLILISGLGIVYYQIIGILTLGILTKNLSFQIHTLIFVPFLIILFLHSFMRWILQNYSSN